MEINLDQQGLGSVTKTKELGSKQKRVKKSGMNLICIDITI